MKRLVYSPKAYVFIKTERNGIVNMTNHITAGRVERKVNMVSSARLTLRNPNRRWTRGVYSARGPFFHPMDPITIWLERIRGYPVQVFSGYLDTTPYLQLFPGTVQVTASCTLKRLIHTYWDPALPFSRNFLAEYGWIPGDSGNIVNMAAEGAGDKLLRQVRAENKGDDKLDDGSIGNLLFAVLKHVVEWDPKMIHIEELPADLIEQVYNIFEVYNEDAKIIRNQLENFIKAYIGDGQYGGGGLTSGDSGPLRGGANTEKAFNFLREFGYTAEQAAGAVGSMMGESTKSLSPTALNPNSGAFGIAQWLGGRKDALMAKPNPRTLETQLNFLKSELQGGESGANSAMKSAKSVEEACLTWTTDFERPSPGEIASSIQTRYEYARSVYNSFKSNDPGARSGGDQILDAQETEASRGGGSSEDKLFNPFGPNQYPVATSGGNEYGNNRGDHIHAGVDIPVPCGQPCIAPFDGTVTYTSTSGFGVAGGMIHLRADRDVAGLNKGDKIGWGHVSAVNTRVGQKVSAGDKIATSGGSPCHVHFVYIKLNAGGNGVDGNSDPTALAKSLQRGESAPGTDPVSDTSGGGNIGYEDILSTAKAAAFVQDMEWPGVLETIEAITLQGPKSLMNDKPILPFIEQLTGAGMRSFQSLPNGHFFAFYPDYFGHLRHRKPYWHINDIEILDGGIDLSDEPLATHVFSVGDTTPPGADPGISTFDRMLSTGVINIFNVHQSGFSPVSERKEGEGSDADKKVKRIISDPQEVINFLKKYGARPHVEEAPFIRSSVFEAFMAYQTFNLMWSRMFLTSFQFTFMPELYPGGIVGLPEHGLQLYIDGVTHDWDYEGGFTTEAQLSAPASMDSDKLSQDPLSFGLVRAARTS